MVSGADDFHLNVWDVEQKRLVKSFDSTNGGHSDGIRLLIRLRDDYAASFSVDKTVKIWNFTKANFMNKDETDSQLIDTLDSNKGGHTDAVIAGTLINGGYNYLATGSADRTVKLWDISNLNDIKLKMTLNAHDNIVSYLVYLENGYLASASYDRTVKIWDINLGKLKYKFDRTNGGHNNSVGTLALLENGYLASCSSLFQQLPGTIKVWDIIQGKLKYTFNITNGGHAGYVWDLAALNDGYLASVSEDTTVKIWDITQGKLKYTFDEKNGGHKSMVWTSLSLGNDFYATGAGDLYGGLGELKIWNVNKGKLEYTFDKDNGGHKSRIYSFALFDNGDFASGSVDKTIKIWDQN